MKLVEENIVYSLCDLELNKAFLDTTPKAQSMKKKNDKLGFSKIKIFALHKTTIRKRKDKPPIERKYLEIIYLIRSYIHNI